MSTDASTPIPVEQPPHRLGKFCQAILLALFCTSVFLDTFNVSALFSAIPIISREVSLDAGSSVWLVSAYQLTFSAFLLCSGRVSDVYNPKIVFVFGSFSLGMLSLGMGFVNNAVALLVLRTISGISAAITIPTSLTLLVRMCCGQPYKTYMDNPRERTIRDSLHLETHTRRSQRRRGDREASPNLLEAFVWYRGAKRDADRHPEAVGRDLLQRGLAKSTLSLYPHIFRRTRGKS
ncbi:MFS general substrate transporter [Exidia glandulosa HHB12029]|uniref:MFS general substrate transporter n=1 Tax=Exidia glandulosa HHB12029 TaxID=1314781 RepID=A0A165Q186_EXIGL|nr:MFS general substrate transporter [Exidia glandulosa HHB12029]